MPKLLFLFLLLMSPVDVNAKEHYLIGLDADLSAVAKEGGIAIQRGAQLAIEEINAQGGVLGKPLKLLSKDHRGNPARGKFNIESFSKEPNLIAILGGVHTPVVLQELELIHKYKIPFLIPWAAGTPIIDNGFKPNYVFRLSVRDAEAAKVLVHAAKENGHKKIALLLEQTGWGRSNEQSMVRATQNEEMDITQISWFNWRQKSMVNELRRINESGATAIILVANAPEGATIIKEVAGNPRFSDLDIYSHWGIANGNFVENVGTENLNKVSLSVLQTYSFLKPHNKTINERVLNQYKIRFDDTVDALNIVGAVGVAHAYDLVHLLAKAINLGNSVSSDKILKSLEKVRDHEGLVKKYQQPFTEASHDALLAPDYFMAQFNESGMIVPASYVKK